MGTLNYTVTRYARTRGGGAAVITSTEVRTSGSHFTTTTAGNIPTLTLSAGEVLWCEADEPMWINFGATAAIGTGHYLGANVPRQFECDTPATVSVIDVA